MRTEGKTRSVPLESWPEADRYAWRRAMAPAGLFVATRRWRRWKDVTWRGVETGYGFWLSWLDQTGQLDLAELPADRVSEPRLEAYVQAMRALGLADFTVAGRLADVGRALSVMAPSVDIAWVELGASRLHAEARPAKDIREALRPAADLVDLGFGLMEPDVGGHEKGGSYASVRFRDGLIIAFLIHCPLRRRNLTALELGRQVEKRAGVWKVDIPAHETKTGVAIRCDWPACLVDSLEEYLAVHRPILIACGTSDTWSDCLWISRQGKPMSAAAVYQTICDRTHAAFGHSINPHLFRHIAATDLATFSPELALAIKGVLGHGTMGPSEKYYNRARTISAGQRMHATYEAARLLLR